MQKLKKGILIAIEGIDGSGKSSLAKNLAAAFEQENYPVKLTKEPGASALGQHIRTLVQEKKVPICGSAEFLLFAADRAQHFHECIIPALAAHQLIISDRLSDSSLVYQGFGRGLDKKMIAQVNEWVMQSIRPDITLYVKVPLAVALARIKERNAQLTSFEKENETFQQSLLEGFECLYKNRSDVIIIDGTQSRDTVTHVAFNALCSWIHTQHLLA